MRIAKQILKEFWLPLTISIIWVLYNIFSNGESPNWDIKKIVHIFGPTFFLLSWLTGQFFRIKKQSKVEDNFSIMETRFKDLIDQVEKKTNDMVAHITGGDSFPWLQIGINVDDQKSAFVTAIHQGEHPLYDVNARLVDLHKFNQIKHNPTLTNISYSDTTLDIGNMIPDHACLVKQWQIGSVSELSYNVFFTARNGSYTQIIRMKKINNLWKTATKVLNRENQVLFERIDDNFPLNSDGEICWK